MSGTLSIFVIAIPCFIALASGLISYYYLPYLITITIVFYIVAVTFFANTKLRERAFLSMKSRRYI